jgi:hypothetical protein
VLAAHVPLKLVPITTERGRRPRTFGPHGARNLGVYRASDEQLYLDLESVLSIPERCPGCDARGLEALFDGEQKNFRCPSSEGSRHVELDGAFVDRATRLHSGRRGRAPQARAPDPPTIPATRSPQMRIGLIAPPWVPDPLNTYGGTEVVIDDNVARGLQDVRHHVQLLTIGESTGRVSSEFR